MSKIVQVINAMISNKEKITNVLKDKKEYFFLYNKKHKWSIATGSDNYYYVHFYPTSNLTLEELAALDNWNDFEEYITYTTKDIKTQESDESFTELYQIVSSKIYGLDDIFNEIINE